MTLSLWHLCNFSAGPSHFHGGFSPEVLRLGPDAWRICAEQVKEQVPEATGMVLHNPHGRYKDKNGEMQMYFDQRSRAMRNPQTRIMASEGRIWRAIADVRSIFGDYGVEVYLGYPEKDLTEDEFMREMSLWALLRMRVYIDGNAHPSRKGQHTWMFDRYSSMSGMPLGIEAVPEVESSLNSLSVPMFFNGAIRDCEGRRNPGMLCHRGTELRDKDGNIIDGTLEETVEKCRRNGFDLCMNLNPQTDISRSDLATVRRLIAEGAEQ